MTRSGGRATPHGVYIHQSTETEWSMLAWHCHTNMTPGSNGIQYWFEICNQIDGKFPMNRDNIIYIYGEDGDIRMTDANVIRLAFHILFHFVLCTGSYLCTLWYDGHYIALWFCYNVLFNISIPAAYRKPIRLKLWLVILTSKANITTIPVIFL